MLGAGGGADGERNALAVVAGGLWCRLNARPRRMADEWRVAAQLQQVCRRYAGRVMAARRGWQQEQKCRRPTAALQRVWSSAASGATAERTVVLRAKRRQHRRARGQLQLSFAPAASTVSSNNATRRKRNVGKKGPRRAESGFSRPQQRQPAAEEQGHGAASASRQSSMVPYMVLTRTARTPRACLTHGL